MAVSSPYYELLPVLATLYLEMCMKVDINMVNRKCGHVRKSLTKSPVNYKTETDDYGKII